MRAPVRRLIKRTSYNRDNHGGQAKRENNCPELKRWFVARLETKTTYKQKDMNTETTTGEYMLLFRGPRWDQGLSTDELQRTMDDIMAWFEGMNERGKIKGAQPLSTQGRTISGTNGRFVVDGPFTETKEAVGGYLVLQADSFDDALEVARTNPALRYGVSVEVRPILAECPIFARHPEIVRRADERAASAKDPWATMAA